MHVGNASILCVYSPSIGIVSAPADKSLIGHAFQSSGGKGYVVLEIKEDHTKVYSTMAPNSII